MVLAIAQTVSRKRRRPSSVSGIWRLYSRVRLSGTRSVTNSSMQQSGLSGLLLPISTEIKNELWRQIVTMRLRAQRLRIEARQRHDWMTYRTVRDMLTLLQMMQRQVDQLMHRLN